MDLLKERLLRYISYDTKSDPDQSQCPSSSGQLVLGEQLVKELEDLGVDQVSQDEHGYIYASIKGNTDGPVIGLIAHMDTAPDMNGKCTHPQIIEYQGGDIPLNEDYTLKVEDFPYLKKLVGHTLITTDGTTLLGADDKAGIAIIMTVAEYFINHPEIKHAEIKIAFTPDEEIGRGADLFDVEKFGADFAFTVDGGPEGELEFENFNAASVNISIQGKNVHPGTAKNTMVNSQRIAMEFDHLLPVEQKPEYTEGYEGFYLLTKLDGTVDLTKMQYIIRDHNRDLFEGKKAWMQETADFLNKKYGKVIQLDIRDSYYNMKEKIQPHMHIIDLAKQAMQEVGVQPDIKPIRGGTDGAKLSYMGLPTPNLFTGGHNFHGRFEFVSLDTMKKAVETVVYMIEHKKN